jgi:hypothetical protein
MSSVLPSRVPKKRTAGVGVGVRPRDARGVAGVVADGSSDGARVFGETKGVTALGAGVAGNGIVASGAGLEGLVAPAMSDVVRLAKCPGARPPVRHST